MNSRRIFFARARGALRVLLLILLAMAGLLIQLGTVVVCFWISLVLVYANTSRVAQGYPNYQVLMDQSFKELRNIRYCYAKVRDKKLASVSDCYSGTFADIVMVLGEEQAKAADPALATCWAAREWLSYAEYQYKEEVAFVADIRAIKQRDCGQSRGSKNSERGLASEPLQHD